MNLYKTSFWAGVSTTYRILVGLITTKIMAIYVGPVGVALLGNFNNIASIFTTFANGAVTTGVTKYIAEYDDDDEKQKVVAHAIKINLCCSVVIGLGILLFHNYLAQLSFGDLEYSSIFIILGCTVVFYGLNTTAGAVLNGYKQIKQLIVTGMIASTISLILAIVITIRFGLYGALANAMIAQFCIFFVYLWFLKRAELINRGLLSIKRDKVLLKKLFKYSAMSIISALVAPVILLIIRNHIMYDFSGEEAGFVQGVWTISAAYLSVITTALSVYYLPTLSGLKTPYDVKKEIIRGYRFLLPLAILGGIAIYLARDLIIIVLYTPEFQPMKQYFLFQVIGDTMKIGSWLLAFLMLAKAMTRWYIATEIIFSASRIGLTFLFTGIYGSVGVTHAYALNYLLYWIAMIYVMRKYLFAKSTEISDERKEG